MGGGGTAAAVPWGTDMYILAAALVICEECTMRSVAANMGVALESVQVVARIHWDFRGTMGVDRVVHDVAVFSQPPLNDMVFVALIPL